MQVREEEKRRRKMTAVVLILIVMFTALGIHQWERKKEMASSGRTTGQNTENAENTENREDGVETAEIFAMDTIMNLTIYGEGSAEAMTAAREMIRRYENLFSVNIEDSDVSKLNRAQGEPVSVAQETYELLERSIKLSEQTKGLFDVSIYPIVKLWGFTTEDYRVPSTTEVEKTLRQVDYKKIRLGENRTVSLEKGMEIDLGGIAKGYLSQKLMELFRERNVSGAIVSLGGNVQSYGKKPDGSPFTVGITDPSDGNSVYGKIEIGEKAVVCSGTYQRFFEKDGKRYHHIMDRRTGAPAGSDLTSVTVIADRGDEADALATALLVMGKEEAVAFAAEHDGIQLILIDAKNEAWTSEGIQLLK